LKAVENIRALQRLGLSLTEIRPILKISVTGYTQEQLMEFLEERLKVIRGKIAELREIEEYISGKLKRLQEERKLSKEPKHAKKKKAVAARMPRKPNS